MGSTALAYYVRPSPGDGGSDMRGGFVANSPVFSAAAARTLARSASAKGLIAHLEGAAEQRTAPISDADKRRTALLDLERTAFSELRHPPEAEVTSQHTAERRPVAVAQAPAAAAAKMPPLGQCIASLLADHPPGQRPPAVVAQLRRYLSPLPYLDPEPRRACVEQICQLADVHVASAGERLARQGETESRLFLLLSGRCSLHLDLEREWLPRWRYDDDDDDDDDGDYDDDDDDRVVGNGNVGGADEAGAGAVSLLARSLRAQSGGAASGVEGSERRRAAALAADARPSCARDDAPAQVEPQLLTADLGDVLAILEPGEVFGERSSLLRAPRGATLVALEASTQLLTLERRHARRLYGHAPPLARKLATLASLQLPLTARHAHSFRTRQYGAGDVVLKAGEQLAEWMLIWSGSICLRVVHRHESTEIAHVCKGGCLADELLLLDTHHGGTGAGTGRGTGGGFRRGDGGGSSSAIKGNQGQSRAIKGNQGSSVGGSSSARADASSRGSGEASVSSRGSGEASVGASVGSSSSRRRGAALPAPVARAVHEAVAIEPTTLLVISAEALHRLPGATLAALTEAAAERRRHRQGVHEAMAAQRSARAASRADAVTRAKAAAPEAASEAAPGQRRGPAALSASTSTFADGAPKEPSSAPVTSAVTSVDASAVTSAVKSAVSSAMPSTPLLAPRLGAGGALAATAGSFRLRPSVSAPMLAAPALDKLKDPVRVLVYGPEAVLNDEVASRFARHFMREHRAMEHVVARRAMHTHPDDPPTINSGVLPERELPRPQYRELANERAAIVGDIRPRPLEKRLADMKKQTLEARLRADRLPFVPQSHAKSMFVRLRRLDMERHASSKKAQLYLMGDSASAFIRQPVEAADSIAGVPRVAAPAETYPRGGAPTSSAARAAEEQHAWNIF